jgi:membrane-anchored mycosin MYCP
VSFLPGSRVAWGDVKQAWQGHGTFNVGLIHAQAPKAKVIVRAILQGEGFATAWETAKGMAELHAAGAQLINMSVGCVTGDRQPPFTLRAAVERLRGKTLLVAAAGNYDPDADGLRPPTWPAALDGVFAVGSITEQSSSSSAFSPDEPWVDLSAVGENVTSTFKDGEVLCLLRGGAKRPRRFWGTAIWSGTSFAAATVTGRLAALAGASAPGPIADELRVGSRRDPVVRQP